jgi:hypothetical protein
VKKGQNRALPLVQVNKLVRPLAHFLPRVKKGRPKKVLVHKKGLVDRKLALGNRAAKRERLAAHQWRKQARWAQQVDSPPQAPKLVRKTV